MDASLAPTVAWLLHCDEPWVVYNTLVELAGSQPESAAVRSAYEQLRGHPAVVALLAELEAWPPARRIDGAYDPKDAIWKLAVVADFGLRRDDERIAAIGERVLAAQAEDGGFLHGGFSHTHAWDERPYICISHVMTYALARFGYLDDTRVQRAYEQALAWQRLDGGWHPNKLNLPGGKKQDEPSCPFGTANVLRALSVHPGWLESEAVRRASDFLLECWQRREEPFRPVGFGIGSEWHKLKYPLVQYQMLKVVDTLSVIPAARRDPRWRQMLDRLLAKRDLDGRWRAESVNQPWAAFDFGQKKGPSPWITFMALRVLKRADSARD